MLSRAIVVQRRSAAAVPRQRDRRVLVRRPMRAAFERRLVQPALASIARRQLDMRRLARMRGAGQRQFLVAEAVGIGRAAFDQRQRLDRLDRRAREHRLVDRRSQHRLAGSSKTATAPRWRLSTRPPRSTSTRTGLVKAPIRVNAQRALCAGQSYFDGAVRARRRMSSRPSLGFQTAWSSHGVVGNIGDMSPRQRSPTRQMDASERKPSPG